MADDEGARDRTEGWPWPVRELTDAGMMRALAHPLRVGLVELLMFEGPLTATECGARLGESAANCSFHLRTLAKHGFVEEAEGGKGRQRPWRVTAYGNSFRAGPSAPPQTRAAADLLNRTLTNRNVRRLYGYFDHLDEYGKTWSDVALVSDVITYLTPDELDSVGTELMNVIRPYMARLVDAGQRPEGSQPVMFFLTGFPTEPAAREEGETDDA